MIDPGKKVNWDVLNPEIQYEGRAIKLPGDPAKMPTLEAMKALKRLMDDEEQAFVVNEIFDAYPHDAAVAFVKAMKKLYGWASPVPTPGFFGPQPPVMLSVKTGVNDDDVVQCPLGSFKLPGVDNLIQTGIDVFDPKKGQQFIVAGKIKKKDRHIVLELVTEARRIVKEESIYRGKSLRLGVDENGNLQTNEPPTFFVSDISVDAVILDQDVKDQIITNILVPIQRTEAARRVKVPLKRTVLLEGPYGTGKSLTAAMVAAVCVQNGWTFVLLDKVQGLRTALEFANRYAPAVVFAEDIDRIASERDESANDLINTIDGVISKRSEIMCVLTTNFAEKLDKAMVRPGRLDAVISLRPPSAETAERLIRHYAGRLLAVTESVKDAGVELAGQIPASIRECVERAKLGMLGREADSISSTDLVVAAKTMKNHLALLHRDNKKLSAAERLAESLSEVVNVKSPNLVPNTDEIRDAVSDVVDDSRTARRVRDIRDIINEIRENTVN